MRKTFIASLALTVLSMAAALPAVTSVNANLRAGPSAKSQVLNVLPRGTKVDVTCSGSWCTISARPGYLARSVLTFAQVQPVPALPASGKGYINVDGVHVASPTFSETVPSGASARCRDGSYSFSLHRRGTCSHHGGVDTWY